jgi:hypothetical protein
MNISASIPQIRHKCFLNADHKRYRVEFFFTSKSVKLNILKMYDTQLI